LRYIIAFERLIETVVASLRHIFKLKTTYLKKNQMEDDLNILVNGRQTAKLKRNNEI
jgi:hypothetical protein